MGYCVLNTSGAALLLPPSRWRPTNCCRVKRLGSGCLRNFLALDCAYVARCRRRLVAAVSNNHGGGNNDSAVASSTTPAGFNHRDLAIPQLSNASDDATNGTELAEASRKGSCSSSSSSSSPGVTVPINDQTQYATSRAPTDLDEISSTSSSPVSVSSVGASALPSADADVSTSTSSQGNHHLNQSSVKGSTAAGGDAGFGAGLVSWFRRLVTEQYLPLMLLGALVAAALKPSWGLAASQTSLQSAVTFAIFVLQGVMLRRGEAEKALSAKGAIAWGLASILVITPLVAPLAGALPLQPPGLALGLLVFACMPTTLSSGVALTQVLGGNTALALLLTISTNLAAVFALPFVLPWALQASAALGGFTCGAPAAGGAAAAPAAVRLDPMPLLVQLVQNILLPTLVGASLRGLFPGLRAWVDSNRRTLSVVSGGLLSLVPWMQVSKALAQGVVVAPGALAAAVGCSLVVHAAYLALNTTAVQVFQLGGIDPRVAAPTRRALIIVASQKTLPVAMAVLGRLAPVLGSEAAGCAAVTVVFSHLAQTCADFWLVSRWTEHIQRREQGEAAAAVAALGGHGTGGIGSGGGGGGGGGGGALRPAAG